MGWESDVLLEETFCRPVRYWEANAANDVVIAGQCYQRSRWTSKKNLNLGGEFMANCLKGGLSC